jgi:ribose transport system substrate-binding protein
MKHSPITGTLALAAVVVLIFSACQAAATPTAAPTGAATGTPGATATTAAKTYTLGFSNPLGVGNGFREEQLCTARAEALVSGQVSKITAIHRNTDVAGQASDIRSLIQAHPDAIVFNPLDKDGLQGAIDEAQAAGIKTIAIDAYVTDAETLNISNDQFNYGYEGAKWLFQQLNGQGNVYYMRGIIGHPADADRHAGVLKALSENPGIHLLPSNDGVGTNWDPATGTQLATDLINSGGYDNIQGIWTSGIDQQVVDAIQAAHKPFVPIVGADLKGFVEQLLNTSGKYTGLKGLAVYNPAAIGGAGVKLALQALGGQTPQITDKVVKNTQGQDVHIKAVFLNAPPMYDNTTDAGKTQLQKIDVAGLDNLWPVSWYIDGWTDYNFQQMLACKGPGE